MGTAHLTSPAGLPHHSVRLSTAGPEEVSGLGEASVAILPRAGDCQGLRGAALGGKGSTNTGKPLRMDDYKDGRREHPIFFSAVLGRTLAGNATMPTHDEPEDRTNLGYLGKMLHY